MQGYHDLHPSLVRLQRPHPASLAALFDVDNTLVPGEARSSVFSLPVAPRSRRMARVEAQCVLVGHTGSVRLDPSATGAKDLSRRKEFGADRVLRAGFFQREMVRNISPKGRDRLEAHRQSGHQLILVSGAPDFLITPLAETLNVSTLFAARIECQGACYTGAVIPPLPYGIENGS